MCIGKKIQEQNTIIDNEEEKDDDEDIPLIHVVYKTNSKNIDNVPLINIKDKIKCSDIVEKRIDENIGKDSVPRTDNLKYKPDYDRISKREGDQKR